jgi:hypothetical protein
MSGLQHVTQKPWDPSPRLRDAAASERRRIERELRRVDDRLARLEREADALRRQRAEAQERLHALDVLAHASPTTAPGVRRAVSRVPPAPAVVRGAHIREIAVRVLAASPDPSRSIPYRDWYRLVVERGIRISGKDPEASFLTQIGRSPVVVRAGRRGMYRIDWGFPDRARSELARLRSEFAKTLDPSDETSAIQIAATQERRRELTRAIARAETQLREALRSLGDDSDARRVA